MTILMADVLVAESIGNSQDVLHVEGGTVV